MARGLSVVFAALVVLGLFQGCGIEGEPPATGSTAFVPSPTIYAKPTFPPTWTARPPTPTNTRVIPIPPTPSPGPSPTSTRLPARTKALVVGIQDSRTVEVLMEGQPINQVFSVRLLGLEAPLLSDPWTGVALEWLAQELERQVVVLESDERERDAQGNLLRYVWKEGRMVNVSLVHLGLAAASEDAATLEFGADLLDAQNNAQNTKRGLWGPPPTATPAPLTATTTMTATGNHTPVPSTTSMPEPTRAMGQEGDQTAAYLATNTQNIELVGHIGGAIGAIFVQGSYAYAGIGPELAILDVSDPNNVLRLGYLILPDMLKDVYVAGDYAYIADNSAGLWVVDLSAPTAPAVVGTYDTPGYARAVETVGIYAYLADDEGLRVVDISDPVAPVEVGFHDTTGVALDVVVAGSYAYVAETNCHDTTCEGSLRVIDVSDPAALVEVGTYGLPGYATDRSVTMAGDYLYIADGYGGLQVVNISDPTDPTQAGFYEGVSFDVAAAGAFVFVATGDSVRMIDASNPDALAEVSSFQVPAMRLTASDGYVYVISRGLEVIDVSDPVNPVQAGLYNVAGGINGLAVWHDQAYLLDQSAGLLEVVDISNPVAPERVGLYDTPREARDVAVADQYAYVLDGDCKGGACEGQLWVVDVSNPAAPIQLGFYQPPEFAWGLTIRDDYAYIASRLNGLRVVKISDPAQPTETGFYDTPGFAMDVALGNGYAYIADRKGGLRIVDVSDPSIPVEIGFYLAPDEAWGVGVAGNYVYVATRSFGLRILDTSNPILPIEVGSYDPPRYASIYGVALAGNYAYLAAGAAGLRVVNIADPTNPTEVGFYDTAGTAEDIVAAHGYIYVADGLGGLVILRFVPPIATS
ncbi:MAG: thermonuclease family protein [Anaerolineales bacterium]|nr:MAG: thermonuclease family protein [Anaerolineales bacterium]